MITVEDVTTIDPAIIELEDGVEYTFKIVDADHPDGFVHTMSAFLDGKGDRGVVWEVLDSYCAYEIIYKDGTNTISSLRDDEISDGVWESHPNYPVSFYHVGETHKINDNYLNSAPLIVHFTRSGNTWSADVTPYELVLAGTAHRPIVGISSSVAGEYATQYMFVGANFNDRSMGYDAVFVVLYGDSATKLKGSGGMTTPAAECTWTSTTINFTIK